MVHLLERHRACDERARAEALVLVEVHDGHDRGPTTERVRPAIRGVIDTAWANDESS
jgi:hypothetical protein